MTFPIEALLLAGVAGGQALTVSVRDPDTNELHAFDVQEVRTVPGWPCDFEVVIVERREVDDAGETVAHLVPLPLYLVATVGVRMRS